MCFTWHKTVSPTLASPDRGRESGRTGVGSSDRPSTLTYRPTRRRRGAAHIHTIDTTSRSTPQLRTSWTCGRLADRQRPSSRRTVTRCSTHLISSQSPHLNKWDRERRLPPTHRTTLLLHGTEKSRHPARKCGPGTFYSIELRKFCPVPSQKGCRGRPRQPLAMHKSPAPHLCHSSDMSPPTRAWRP